MVEAAIPILNPNEAAGAGKQRLIERLAKALGFRAGESSPGPQQKIPDKESSHTKGFGDEKRLRGEGVRGVMYELLEEVADKLFVDRSFPSYLQGIASRLAEVQAEAICGGPDNKTKKISGKEFDRLINRLCAIRGLVAENTENIDSQILDGLRILGIQQNLQFIYDLPKDVEDQLRAEAPDLIEPARGLARLLGGQPISLMQYDKLPRVWKQFLEYTPPETLRYHMDVSKSFDLANHTDLADLLYATASSFWEIEGPARDSGQPIGNLRYTKSRTHVEPAPSFSVAFYKSDESDPTGKRIIAKVVDWKKDAHIEHFRKQVDDALNSGADWFDQEKQKPGHALVAVNLTAQIRPYSSTAVEAGFNIARTYNPFMVYYTARDIKGNLRLQTGFDHTSADGMLASLFLRGGTTKGVHYSGVAGYYDKVKQNEGSPKRLVEKDTAVYENVDFENYGDVVLARIPWKEDVFGADMHTYALLWTWQTFLGYMQEHGSPHWRKLIPNVAANFPVTNSKNVLQPLVPASCWYANPEIFDKYPQLRQYRHVIPAFLAMCGFKREKDKASFDPNRPFVQREAPEGIKLMSLVVNSRLPGRLKRLILSANRDERFTVARAILFPPTIPTEKDRTDLDPQAIPSCLHTTVANEDTFNATQRISKLGLDIVFSANPKSQFLPPEILSQFVHWAAPAIEELLNIWKNWQENPRQQGLLGLNAKIEELYLRKRKELKAFA